MVEIPYETLDSWVGMLQFGGDDETFKLDVMEVREQLCQLLKEYDEELG